MSLFVTFFIFSVTFLRGTAAAIPAARKERSMLKTLKLFLLTITFALLGAFSAFAGEDSCGHLDFLNETGVSGWCYQNSQPSSPADFTMC
mgnify:FL=1